MTTTLPAASSPEQQRNRRNGKNARSSNAKRAPRPNGSPNGPPRGQRHLWRKRHLWGTRHLWRTCRPRPWSRLVREARAARRVGPSARSSMVKRSSMRAHRS